MDKDVKRLIEIWENLHALGGELRDIEKRHPDVKGIQKVMKTAIDRLAEVSHMLFSEAHEIRKKEIEDENK